MTNLRKLKDQEQLYQIMFHIWISYTICRLHSHALLPRFVGFFKQINLYLVCMLCDITEMLYFLSDVIAEEISGQTSSCWSHQVGSTYSLLDV